MQGLQKQLKIRRTALPTLKSKEAYLRIVIKKQKKILEELRESLEKRRAEIAPNERLWVEFPLEHVRIASVDYSEENIAGIKVPTLGDIHFSAMEESALIDPSWFPWGLHMAQKLSRALAEISVAEQRILKLEYARKKTTQKVNLYEKVQIPEFAELILKIKRYIEDVENLEKATQKITRNRQKIT